MHALDIYFMLNKHFLAKVLGKWNFVSFVKPPFSGGVPQNNGGSHFCPFEGHIELKPGKHVHFLIFSMYIESIFRGIKFCGWKKYFILEGIQFCYLLKKPRNFLPAQISDLKAPSVFLSRVEVLMYWKFSVKFGCRSFYTFKVTGFFGSKTIKKC